MLFSQNKLCNFKHVEIGQILTDYKTYINYFIRPGHDLALSQSLSIPSG